MMPEKQEPLICENCDYVGFDVYRFDEIFCEYCADGETWTKVVCKDCYNKTCDLQIFIDHCHDEHTSVDLV